MKNCVKLSVSESETVIELSQTVKIQQRPFF